MTPSATRPTPFQPCQARLDPSSGGAGARSGSRPLPAGAGWRSRCAAPRRIGRERRRAACRRRGRPECRCAGGMPAPRTRRPAARDRPRSPHATVMRLGRTGSRRQWRWRYRHGCGRGSAGLAARLLPLSWRRAGAGRAAAAHPPRRRRRRVNLGRPAACRARRPGRSRSSCTCR